MWQRFTDRARKVILLGQQEARRIGSGSVGTEHLLLGLVRENEGVAAQVLDRMGISLARVWETVEQKSPLREETRSGEPGLSPRSKRVLELAADEARSVKHNYIGTEHLLLALIREIDGVAAKVLRRLGLDLEKVRRQVMWYLGPEAGESPAVEREPEPEPDLYGAFENLLHVVDDQISNTTHADAKELLSGARVRLDNLRYRWFSHRDTGNRFELTAECTLRFLNWYKEQAIIAAEYERAADLRDFNAEVSVVIDDIRKLLALKPEGEAMPESDTP